MASAHKIREGVYCISWVNPTWVTTNNIEVSDLKDIFTFCKLAYTAVGNDVNLEVELTLTEDMKLKSSLESITILASKYGVKQYMKFEDNKWKTTLHGNPYPYICCGRTGLHFELVIDATPSSMVLIKKESKHVLNHLLNLWTNKTLADVTFECQGKAVKAHMLIISSGSPVFAAMFQNDFQEKEKRVVEIKDIQLNVLEKLLQFIYVGDVDLLKNIEVAELFVAADKYGVDALKEECASQLVRDISVENASRLLVLAHKHNSSVLHQSTLNFMSKNAKAICSRKDWMEIIKNYPELSFAAMQMMVMG